MRARIEWLLQRPLLLVAAVALLVALPLTIAGEISAEQSRAILRQQEMDAARTSAAAAANATNAWLAGIREDVAALVETADLKASAAARDSEAIGRSVRAALPYLGVRLGPGPSGSVRWIFVTDRTGLVLHESANETQTVGRDLSGADLIARLRDAARPGEVTAADVLGGDVWLIPVGRASGAQTSGSVQPSPSLGVLLGARIRHAVEPFVGTLLVQPRVEQLESTLRGQIGDATDAYLIDRSGALIVHATRESSGLRRPLGEDMRGDSALSIPPERGAEARRAGQRVIGSAPVGDTGWHVALDAREGIRVAAIESDLAQQRALRLALVAVLLGGAVVLGRTASASIRRRDELAESLEQQAAVGEILRVIARSPSSLDPIFVEIARYSVRLCRAERCLIWLREGQLFRTSYGSTKGSVQLPHESLRSIALPIDRRSIPGRVVLEDAPVQIHIQEDAELRDDFKQGNPSASAVGVPLRKDGEIVGVIVLLREQRSVFTPREISIVETFAQQAVIAIENVRLFNETTQALAQQSATNEVLEAISRFSLDLMPVFDLALSSAVRLSGADGGLTCRIVDGNAEVVARAGTRPIAEIGDRFPSGGNWATSIAMRENRTVHVPDVEADPVAPRQGLFKTRLVVPIRREGEPVGTIYVGRRMARPFTPREIALVESFADQIAIAIENVRLLNEIQEKSRELEAASRHKSQFLASMSHELRTPLNAIIGFNEVVAQGMAGPITDKQREYITDALTAAHHLLALINEILDLSKVEAGRMELEPSTFSLRDLVEASTAVIRERASRHGIALRADIDGVDTVEADERKVRQVLFNLLSNAVKFTPDGGEIEVKGWHVDAEWGVSVRDTGPGIPPADRDRIFEEFQQSRASGARVSEGTGLGLTLSRKFVELHGGRLWVDSEVGKGSTFTFAIPRAREHPLTTTPG